MTNSVKKGLSALLRNVVENVVAVSLIGELETILTPVRDLEK